MYKVTPGYTGGMSTNSHDCMDVLTRFDDSDYTH